MAFPARGRRGHVPRRDELCSDFRAALTTCCFPLLNLFLLVLLYKEKLRVHTRAQSLLVISTASRS
jgi:hypothetical protein